MAALPGNNGQRGFTLLEVVAALTLLGVGLAVLYAGYLQAAYMENRVAERGLAMVLARTKLAQAEAGEESGREGQCEGASGYRWIISRDPLGETGLDRLTVKVTFGDGSRRAVSVWALVSHGT